MALRKVLAKRLFNATRLTSPPASTELSPMASKTLGSPMASKTSSHCEYLTSQESAETGFFRRFLHRRAFSPPSMFSEFLIPPVGERLKEKLYGINIGKDRLRLDGLSSPASDMETGKSVGGISVQDARKILRLARVEKLKARLREATANSISYSEFVGICAEECDENEDQGVDFAKLLDDSGNVIVLGNVVFLRPEQVAKSVETLISQSIAKPNDPRRKELDQMEAQKAQIDKKAHSLVRGELYCGLGFLVIQTLGFMRLTFWELSWDVMEPICFFVGSMHFALAYTFFLRSSKEPSFEGYFQRRFKTKQMQLFKTYNFNVEKYNKLRKACYRNSWSEQGEGAFLRGQHASLK